MRVPQCCHFIFQERVGFAKMSEVSRCLLKYFASSVTCVLRIEMAILVFFPALL